MRVFLGLLAVYCAIAQVPPMIPNFFTWQTNFWEFDASGAQLISGTQVMHSSGSTAFVLSYLDQNSHHTAGNDGVLYQTLLQNDQYSFLMNTYTNLSSDCVQYPGMPLMSDFYGMYCKYTEQGTWKNDDVYEWICSFPGYGVTMNGTIFSDVNSGAVVRQTVAPVPGIEPYTVLETLGWMQLDASPPESLFVPPAICNNARVLSSKPDVAHHHWPLFFL